MLGVFEAAGLRPIPVDLPGQGQMATTGSGQPYTLEAAFGIVQDAVGGSVEPSTIVGYSMGGRIGLQYAIRHTDRVARLVLESASPGLRTVAEREARRVTDAALGERIISQGIETFVDEWEALPLFASQQTLPDRVRAAVRERRLRNDPRSLSAALEGLGTGALPSLWPELAGLDIPVLLLVGERDSKFVEIARSMSKEMPDVRLVVVPDVGHAVHLEAPDAWSEAVGDFLRES